MLQKQEYTWKSKFIKGLEMHLIEASAAGHASFHWQGTEVLSAWGELSFLPHKHEVSPELGREQRSCLLNGLGG